MKIAFYFQDDGMLIPNEYKKKTENNYKKAVIHIVYWLEKIITEHIYILRQQVSPFHERAFQVSISITTENLPLLPFYRRH